MVMNRQLGHWCGLVILVMLTFCFAVSQPVLADTNIQVTVSDPDRLAGDNREGNTINTPGVAPSVSIGENQVLGTFSITGKPGIQVPVQVGNRIKISLSPGVCYMKVPTSSTYRKYVSWPKQVGEENNQICDSKGIQGMIFECATPHSMVLRVGNIDTSAKAMLLCFNFDQKDYSCVRVAPFIGIVDQYANDSVNKVTRLEFFKLFTAIAPNSYIRLEVGQPTITMEQKFSDLGSVSPADREIIRPLIDSMLVYGYSNGLLKPDANITRNEAFALTGRSFGYVSMPRFRDGVANWGDASINYGARRFLYWGYSDGTFRGDNAISRPEALELLQNCFETRAMERADKAQGRILGFI